MKIKFLGANGTVTGSKHLLMIDDRRILIDCGLFQGYKDLRLRNWAALPVDPASIDAVLITHAHIDHSGYLPLLVKNGFKGLIYATGPTYALCEILLKDSAYLQEEDARRANEYGYSKHKPALPLYTLEDAEKALKQFKAIHFDQVLTLFNEIQVSWHRAGHILGAALVKVEAKGKSVLFSGDLGRLHDPVMNAPVERPVTDYLVLESTYGDRLHDKTDPKIPLAEIIHRTFDRAGTLLIPAFAVGRAQSVLYYLAQLKKEKLIPSVPIYLDSPMAINATKLLHQYKEESRLTDQECQEACAVAKYVNTPEESRALTADLTPKIIISASGMITGGRILHHLKMFGNDPRNTILMTGFQAGGTRGAQLLQGSRVIKMYGEWLPIKAEIQLLTNLSAHADYEEMMIWLKESGHSPKKVFITHGEPNAARALKARIESELKWSCQIPSYLQEEML